MEVQLGSAPFYVNIVFWDARDKETACIVFDDCCGPTCNPASNH